MDVSSCSVIYKFPIWHCPPLTYVRKNGGHPWMNWTSESLHRPLGWPLKGVWKWHCKTERGTNDSQETQGERSDTRLRTICSVTPTSLRDETRSYLDGLLDTQSGFSTHGTSGQLSLSSEVVTPTSSVPFILVPFRRDYSTESDWSVTLWVQIRSCLICLRIVSTLVCHLFICLYCWN